MLSISTTTLTLIQRKKSCWQSIFLETSTTYTKKDKIYPYPPSGIMINHQITKEIFKDTVFGIQEASKGKLIQSTIWNNHTLLFHAC